MEVGTPASAGNTTNTAAPAILHLSTGATPDAPSSPPPPARVLAPRLQPREEQCSVRQTERQEVVDQVWRSFGRGADTVPSAHTPPPAQREGRQAAGGPCPHCTGKSTSLGNLCGRGPPPAHTPNTGTTTPPTLMGGWGPGKDFKFTARPPIELTADCLLNPAPYSGPGWRGEDR
ncbi:unnamed protein product [Pleuronectes platessa]|uniref:Uncharacterized protein n=1 Tax=Pleuronectes platessa TaxID=8262 RepID=A0A9N7YVH1_PLEPL|nr:unnamed protein product [Pleuronectes platessa]